MSHFGQIVRPCFGRMEYELMRSDLTYMDLPDHLSLHEPTQNSGGAPLQREDGEFPVRTGTQRTRNSPLHAVMPAWAIYSEPPPNRRMTIPVEIQ